MDINEIISDGRPVVDIIADLKDKSIPVPAWSDLEKDYDPTKHEIMTNPALRPREAQKERATCPARENPLSSRENRYEAHESNVLHHSCREKV